MKSRAGQRENVAEQIMYDLPPPKVTGSFATESHVCLTCCLVYVLCFTLSSSLITGKANLTK